MQMTFNMQYLKYFILILTIYNIQMNLKQLAVRLSHLWLVMGRGQWSENIQNNTMSCNIYINLEQTMSLEKINQLHLW